MAPQVTLPPKLKVFDSWKSEYLFNHHTHSSAPWISCPPLEDSNPPPPHSSKGPSPLNNNASYLLPSNSPHATNSTPIIPINFGLMQGPAGDVTTCPCSSSLRPIRYTIKHVIFHFPLHNNYWSAIFGPQPTTNKYVFGTYHGGRKLGEFLLATQAFLRPLPP